MVKHDLQLRLHGVPGLVGLRLLTFHSSRRWAFHSHRSHENSEAARGSQGSRDTAGSRTSSPPGVPPDSPIKGPTTSPQGLPLATSDGRKLRQWLEGMVTRSGHDQQKMERQETAPDAHPGPSWGVLSRTRSTATDTHTARPPVQPSPPPSLLPKSAHTRPAPGPWLALHPRLRRPLRPSRCLTGRGDRRASGMGGPHTAP